MDFWGAAGKPECTELDFSSTKDHSSAAEIFKSVQLGFPVIS